MLTKFQEHLQNEESAGQMESKQTGKENRQIMVGEYEGREIQFEIWGPSPEEEEHFLNAVVDFLSKIQGNGT